MTKAEILNRRETRLLREDILQQMRGLNIVKVNIYDVFGTNVFSTESAVLRDAEAAIATMRKLKDAGSEIFDGRFWHRLFKLEPVKALAA
jgi:hypothetical protein